jgi:Ca2+-binding EF-hand superfamily protein
MSRSLALAAAIVLGAVSSLPAQETKKPEAKKPLPPAVAEMLKATPEDLIKRFDKDGDKVLTRDESPPFIAKAFDKADRDGDGKLNRSEVATLLQVLRGFLGEKKDAQTKVNEAELDRFVDGLLKQFDSDRDGKIARTEAKARLADNFDQLDQNKSGFLERPELRPIALKFMQFKKGPPGGAETKPGPDFDALDKDADGRLSRAELTGTPWAARFADIDADTSDMIDRREFEAFVKKQAK